MFTPHAYFTFITGSQATTMQMIMLKSSPHCTYSKTALLSKNLSWLLGRLTSWAPDILGASPCVSSTSEHFKCWPLLFPLTDQIVLTTLHPSPLVSARANARISYRAISLITELVVSNTTLSLICLSLSPSLKPQLLTPTSHLCYPNKKFSLKQEI